MAAIAPQGAAVEDFDAICKAFRPGAFQATATGSS